MQAIIILNFVGIAVIIFYLQKLAKILQQIQKNTKLIDAEEVEVRKHVKKVPVLKFSTFKDSEIKR